MPLQQASCSAPRLHELQRAMVQKDVERDKHEENMGVCCVAFCSRDGMQKP